MPAWPYTLLIAASLSTTFQGVAIAACPFGGNDLPFGDIKILNTNGVSDTGHDAHAQVATDGSGRWIAIWESNDDLGGTIGTDWDILVAISTNGGQTWTDPRPLNHTATTDNNDADLAPDIAIDGGGTWIAVWESSNDLGGTIGGDTDILFAVSTDGGLNWTDARHLNSNATSASIGADRAPRVATDGRGNWITVWMSWDDLGGTIDADNDILFARSTNDGATWSNATYLNQNAFFDAGADESPRLATDSLGNWIAVWESTDNLGGDAGQQGDDDIFVSRSGNNGLSWTYPEPLNSNADVDSGPDWTPEITSSGDGTWVAAWWSRDTLGGTIGFDSDILSARSTNNGLSWSYPAAVNSSAPGGGPEDFASPPRVVTDQDGTWLIVWVSADSLDNTLGTDWDILASRSEDDGLTWQAAEAVNDNADSDSGNDEQPAAVTDGTGNLLILWSSWDDLNGTVGTDMDILATTITCDRDRDGLPDRWETDGLDVDGDGTIDLNLPGLGADPDHKDLFVEVDSMSEDTNANGALDVGEDANANGVLDHRQPSQTALDAVVAAFAAAPDKLVKNPDGLDGISLHIDVDEVYVPFVNNWPDPWAGFDGVKADHFGTQAQRNDANSAHILEAKAKVYRYCVFANRYSGGTSSGKSELPGNDFMVTLGGWSTPGGTIDQQAGTFMHEFGHTLNLRHGGGDNINYKPNYVSVMNYTWQTPHPAYANTSGWQPGYSEVALPALDESNLDESIGISSNGIPGHLHRMIPVGPTPQRLVHDQGPVDWNRDGDTDDSGVAADINHTRTNVAPSPGDVLHGHDDWSNLRFGLRGHPDFADGMHSPHSEIEELTYEIYQELGAGLCVVGATTDLADYAGFQQCLQPMPGAALPGVCQCYDRDHDDDIDLDDYANLAQRLTGP